VALLWRARSGRLAQLGEHHVRNVGVVGSNPMPSTKLLGPRMVKRLPIAVLLVLSSRLAAQSFPAVRLNPENPRYFLFRGKPLALITATEHYGSVINRPFNFERYLDDAARHKMTLTRTFLLFRELQSARNPWSPCKPDSPDYIAPFPRTGPGKALDGEPTYDLDKWNPEYFDRLHRFLDAASKRSIVVELTLFSNTYAESVWALNPFRAENNNQRLGHIQWQEYLSLKDKELVRRQSEYARKIIQETSGYDNVYYEICNEAGGGIPGHVSTAEVDQWQKEIARVIGDEMRRLKSPHLVAGGLAFAYGKPFVFAIDETFRSPIFQIVNVHPLPDSGLQGRLYQLGHFMSKELMLAEVAQFCRAAYKESKPTVLDEDNAASIYRDTIGWTIHRKRAWTALLSGAHYDYIDFSVTVGNESGTAASRKEIRGWMQHLSDFVASFDYVHSKPAMDWLEGTPKYVVSSALAAGDRDYVAYLADGREVTDQSSGEAISGTVSLSLPPGRFAVRLYSPVTGEYSPSLLVTGGERVSIDLPVFKNDIALRATRAGAK
jgi:Family of unknown function (DUF6298)